jgi:hypothetical protein
VPIQTRCPSCSAAIPTNAAWCSLCHSDLRPRPAPRAAAPAAAATIVVAPVPGTVLQEVRPESEAPVHELDHELDLDLDDDPAPVGRHSRQEPTSSEPAPRPSRALPPRGKHAGSRRAPAPARRTSVPTLALDELELPAGEATAEQVDELADQMLTHLALTEPQPRLLDPDDFPGGRWGLAGAGLVAMIVILLVLYTVLGVIFG